MRSRKRISADVLGFCVGWRWRQLVYCRSFNPPFGIDAPELRQTCTRNSANWPCGAESKHSLQATLEGKRVNCRGRGVDVYGRTLAVCSVNGVEINSAMVTRGWATAFRKYSDAYVAAENVAKAARAEIWN